MSVQNNCIAKRIWRDRLSYINIFFDTNFKKSYQTENCNWPLFRPVAKGNPNKSTNKHTPKPLLWLIWHNSAQSNRYIGYVYICFKVSLITTPSTYPTLTWKALLEAPQHNKRIHDSVEIRVLIGSSHPPVRWPCARCFRDGLGD